MFCNYFRSCLSKSLIVIVSLEKVSFLAAEIPPLASATAEQPFGKKLQKVQKGGRSVGRLVI